MWSDTVGMILVAVIVVSGVGFEIVRRIKR